MLIEDLNQADDDGETQTNPNGFFADTKTAVNLNSPFFFLTLSRLLVLCV